LWIQNLSIQKFNTFKPSKAYKNLSKDVIVSLEPPTWERPVYTNLVCLPNTLTPQQQLDIIIVDSQIKQESILQFWPMTTKYPNYSFHDPRYPITQIELDLVGKYLINCFVFGPPLSLSKK